MVRILLLTLSLAAPLTWAGDSVTFSFEKVPAREFAKVIYGDYLKTGYVIHDAGEDKPFSLYLSNAKKADVERIAADIFRSAGYSVHRENGVTVLQRETSDELEVLTYRPAHRAPQYLIDLVKAAFPDAQVATSRALPNVSSSAGWSSGAAATQNSAAPAPAPSSVAPITGNSGTSALFDREDMDTLVFRVPAQKKKKVEDFLSSVDLATPQVQVKGVAYEVTVSHGEGSALELLASVLGSQVGLEIKGALKGADTFLRLKSGDISAVIAALDSDTRFKSISRPLVRVKSGGSARFSVGADVPVLGAVVSQQGGNAVQSVDYRPSGVLLDVSPVVRSEAIDLKIRQEISGFVRTSTGLENSPTLNKRLIESSLSVTSGEWLVVAGLEEEQNTESENRLPFLGWKFGTSSDSKKVETLLLLEVTKI